MYNIGIQPVQGQRLWPVTNRLPVLPPPARVNMGRPKNHDRKKAAHEKNSKNSPKLSRDNRVMTCSNFKAEGHNKTTSKNGFVEPPPKRPIGRTRNHQSQEPEVKTSQVQTSQDQGPHYEASQPSQEQGWEYRSYQRHKKRVCQNWEDGNLIVINNKKQVYKEDEEDGLVFESSGYVFPFRFLLSASKGRSNNLLLHVLSFTFGFCYRLVKGAQTMFFSA